MANLGKIDYSEIDKYINSPLPKLGEVNLSPKMDNVQYSETSRPKLAAPIDYSKYEDKPFYDDAAAIAKSIGKGAVINLPEMAGQAAQALSPEGSAVSNWGKGVVESAKSRAKDWQVDMAGRGTIAKSLIEGGEMIAPSLATLPAYLAGPMAGAAATIALYGGSSYQDVYERSKAAGLSDSDAHKAGLMEGAIEAGGELISNKLSLGLLGAGKKAGMAAVTSGTLDQSVLKPFGKAFAKEAVGEQLTEGLQNYGQSKVEGAYGLSKEKGLGESFSETFGPTLGMSVLLSPFGLAGHYVSSKSNQESNERAKAIQHVLDSPESGNKMDRRRVVEMLHSDALKAGVDPKEASAWKAQAIIDIANNQPIYRGEVEAEKDLPDTSDKANKDLLPTGERLQNKDLFKTYSKFDNLYKIHDDPSSEDYQSGYQAIISSLSSLINPEEGKAVDPVKQDEARKVLKLVEDANAVKTRQFNRQLEADKAAAQIDQEEVNKEVNEPDSSIEEIDDTQIDPEELKRLMDEDTGFNGPIDTESTNVSQEPIEPIDTAKPDATVSAPVSRTDEVISKLNEVDTSDKVTEVPAVPADSSQVEAAQGEAVSEPVQPVGQEEAKAPKASREEIDSREVPLDAYDKWSYYNKILNTENLSPEDKTYFKEKAITAAQEFSDKTQEKTTKIKEPKAKTTKPKTTKETKEIEIIPQDSEITILRDKVATKGNYSIPPKFTGENGEIKGKVVGPKLSKTGKVLGYYITTDYKNFDGSIETTTHLISASSIKGLNETPKDRIVNTTSLNEEISADKVAVEQGSEDPEVIQNSQEPVQSLEPKDASRIDDVLAELEDLRDQLEVAEIEDRKEIRSSIKELEATLKELGYAERQSKVKFTTSEDSESAKDEEDEWTHETKDDVLGFTLDDNGEELFDIDFQDESLTSLLEDKRKGTLKVLESIGFSQKAKNKYSYVKAKMKEVNSSQEEQNVINKALEQLGQDGKWSWPDLVDLVILQLSDVSLSFVENKQKFSDFGFDRLGLSELDIEKNWKFELRVTGSSGEDLKFSDVPNLKGHDLTDKAIAHIRTFKNREGIWHIAEVQSDVKQEPSFNKDIREKQLVVAKKLKDLSTDDINKISLELLDIRDSLTDDIRSLAAEERLDGPSKDIAGRLIDRIILFVDNVEAIDKASIISDSSLQDLVSEVKSYSIAVASKLRGNAPDFFDELYSLESVRKFAVSIINKARLDYSPANYEGIIETAKSFEDSEYQRLKPYIEKRAIRQYIKDTLEGRPENEHTFRIATPETLIKIESWDREIHKDLIRKYTELSKSISKELGFKEVVDKAGNTWYEGVVSDSYVPLAYDLSWITDNTKTLAQIKKNQAINKRSFDKFLNNISPAIKKEVVFKFIPDFRDADLSSEGLSDKAETARGVYKVIDGVPHIFVNGAIDPKDFAGTFIHEVVGHFGVRKLFDRFDKDHSSSLSNYDKFLVNLINNNSFFRSQIINRFSNWSNYESNFIKRNKKTGETTDQMYSRLQSEYKGTGNVVLEFTVDMPTGKEKRKIPVEVAVQLADEHIAELAKELYFDKKFIEKEVGLGVSTDSIRASKSAQFKSFMKMVFDKIRHYMRSIFGEYVNTLTQDDLNRMVAASFSNIFHIVDSEMLKTYESSEATPRRTVKKKYIVNNSGYNVSIDQSNESTRLDQDVGLEENEITNPFLLADIPELSKFIDLTVSGFGNHNDTIRSEMWKKLQEKINDNPLLSSLKALGNMPFQEAYTAIQNVYKGQIAKVESTVKDMASVLEGLNASTNDAIFEYMTNPNQDVTLLNITPRQQEVVKNAKDTINELGRVSMELGLIPEKSYEANKDAYLHTMYLKYLDQYRGSGKSTSLLSWMKAKKKLNARERAALGEIKDVKFLIAETLGVISRDHVLINMFNTVAKSSNRNGLYWTLTNEDKIKLPWDNRKVATIDKAYKLVDDMAFIISESKGENKVTFDGKESTIANLVKDREEIISRINALENKALEEAHKHALDSGFTTHEDQHEFLRNHYVRMPNTARYGLLRNQWVRKEIHNDLDVLTASYDLSNKDNIEKFFARGGTLEKINRLWKMSMVALNPGSWIRNIAGNFTLLDLSTSTSSTKLIGMLHSEIMKTMADKKPSEFWKLAEEYGLFGTTFSAVELQDMYSKYGDELEAARASYEAREGSSWEKSIPLFDNRFIAIGKMLAKGKDLGHRTTATTSKAYAFVEGAFKTVSFKDYILTWESQNQQEFPGGWKSLDETQQRALFAKAAAHANEALFDYSQVPSAIKTLRRIPFGAPFLTFSYKAGPASVRAMINHPVKFAKYATLPALLTMIAMATNDWDDKDIAHFKARLPEYYRNNPGIAFLPFKDEKGRPQILPLDYLLPWSQWATASRKVYANFVEDGGESPIGTSVQSVGTVLNEFGFLGGPTPTALAAMLSGKDSFTGRSILTAGASADQQLMEAMLFTYNMAAPAWLSSHGWFSKMYQAFGKPDTNQFGEVRFTPAQAVSDITGFRAISVLEKGGLESRRKEFEFRLKEISTYRSQVIRDRSENSISKASKLKDIAIREKMVRTQMREALTQ